MHSAEAVLDNGALHDVLRPAAARGFPLGAAAAALAFPAVREAVRLYAARGGAYWVPLWQEIAAPTERAFRANAALAFAATMASSHLCLPLLSEADSVSPTLVEQTLGIVARRWFAGANAMAFGEQGFRDVGWAIGLVDCVESFTLRARFPYVRDCVAEPPIRAEVMVSRQMLLLAVEHEWSLRTSLENGEAIASALSQ